MISNDLGCQSSDSVSIVCWYFIELLRMNVVVAREGEENSHTLHLPGFLVGQFSFLFQWWQRKDSAVGLMG